MTDKFQSEIEVFADIPSWWVISQKPGAKESAQAGISDFINLSGVALLTLWDGKKFPIYIDVFDKPSAFRYFSSQGRKRRFALPKTFVRLYSRIEYTEQDLLEFVSSPREGDWTFDQRVRIYVETACTELYSTLIDLYLAASVASPGSFYFWETWLYVDQKLLKREDGALSSLDNARERAAELKWPPIQTLSIRDVYTWLQHLPGFNDRRGIGRVGRAVAALSYLIKTPMNDQGELSLVWALLGLEALYGVGNVGLKSQLLEKSEALLGPRLANKKQYGWMYDFRSRLIHGDTDLLFRHNDFDGTPEFEKSWSERYECEGLAAAVLLATLQYLCINKTYSLEFKYSLIK